VDPHTELRSAIARADESYFLAALNNAAAALRRAGGGRRPKKRKKVKAAGARPVGPGANVACGTGKGGFGVGNQCAKEDGIPQKPLSHGGALKKVNASEALARAKAMREKAAAKKAAQEALDKKKSIETKPQRDKQKQINKLRSAAAKRKAEKGERDAAEKQAAQEAADKRRAEMLQKIRIKKANKELNIVEAPPGKFSGQIDTSIKKLEGETQVDFAKRRIDADLKKFHSEMEAIEKRFEAERKALSQKKYDIDEAISNAERERTAFAQKIIGPDSKPKKPKKEEVAEYERMKGDIQKLMEERREVWKKQDLLEDKYNKEAHDLVGEFTRAHNGGKTATFDASKQYHPETENASGSKFYDGFKKNAQKAWAFLSKVSSPMHQAKGSAVRVKLDTSRGSADYTEGTETARHGTKGTHGDYNTSDPVIVHEIAHGLHYGPRAVSVPSVDANGRPKLPKVEEFMAYANTPGFQTRAAIKEDYDARVAKFKAEHNGEVQYVQFSSERENYKLWTPKGQKRQSESYLGYSNQYADAENGSATGATEVISMGVQHVYEKPRYFRRWHTSHFDLTLLFLAGRIH